MRTHIFSQLRNYAALTRLNRPIGIWLLLWPTLWALWVAANGWPGLKLLGIFIAGVVLMRSAGCVVNDYTDRQLDGHVARTQQRPLATGQVSSREALALFILLTLLAASLLFLLPPLARWLAIPAVIITVLYPRLKRYTHLPQLALGVAFSWGIPMAFAATLGYIPLTGWWLFGIACLWPVAYDTMYAMADRQDDLRVGIKSTAILFGRKDIYIIALLHGLMLSLLVLLGWHLDFGLSYYLGLFLAFLVIVYLQYLIKNRDPARCFKAFLISHWVGGAIFLGLVFQYLRPAV